MHFRLSALRLGTNYEEGTAIESGIDNCLSSLSTTINGNNLDWSVNFGSTHNGVAGDARTIDHYEFWDSLDNTNFTQIDSSISPSQAGCAATGASVSGCSLNIASFLWEKGTHNLYVQAVGKASIQNHLSTSSTFVAAPATTFTPSSLTLTFAAQDQGTTSPSQPMTLANTGNAVLHIGTLSITGDFQIQSDGCFNHALNPGASCAVGVTFTPTNSGARSGTLTFNDNAGTSQQTVSLSGTGNACQGTCVSPATATPNPKSLAYSVQTVNTTSAAQTVQVTNSGGDALTVSSITVSGDFAVSSNTCGTSIGAGSNCQIGITFTPLATGSRSGALTINGVDASTSASVTTQVLLTGTSGSVIYAGLDDGTSWTMYNDPAHTGGQGTATSSLTEGSSPTDDGNGSAQFSIGGSVAYSNATWEHDLTPNDQLASFSLSANVYMTDPTVPQGFFIGAAQAISNQYYVFYFYCDFRAGSDPYWRLWDSAGQTWSTTNVACSPSSFNANGWTHLSFDFERVNGQAHYKSITVGSTTTVLTNPVNAYFNPATKSPDSLEIHFGEFGNYAQQSYSIWVDDLSLAGSTGSGQTSGALASFSPGSLAFGVQSVGTSTTSQSVRLTSTGTAALTISSISTSPEFTITSNPCPGSLSPGASCIVGVEFTPAASGTRTGTLTVSGNATATAALYGTGAGSLSFNNVDDSAGWTSCTSASCAGGNGTSTTNLLQAVSNPSEDSDGSAQFSLGGTGSYSNAVWTKALASSDSVSHFTVTADVYMTDPTVPQGFHIGIGQSISNNYYVFEVLCDLKSSHTWKVWNPGGGANPWYDTGSACTASMFSQNSWTHFSFDVQRTTGNQMQYVKMAYGTNIYDWSSVPAFTPATLSPDQTVVKIGLSGDSHQDAYSLWIDQLNIIGW